MVSGDGWGVTDKFPLIIYFLSVYILITGAAYTLGYWALFPINIFDYIGVVDIAKSSIPGLMVSVLIVSSQFIARVFTNKFSSKEQPVEESKITSLLLKYKRILLAIYILLPTCLYALMELWPSYAIKYHGIVNSLMWFFSFLSIVVIYVFFVSNGYVRSLSFSKYMLGLTILSLVFVTLASFAVGFGRAVNIISGYKFSYISTTLSDFEIDVENKDRYLGFYGGKYLLWEPNKKLVKIISGDKDINVKAFDSNVSNIN